MQYFVVIYLQMALVQQNHKRRCGMKTKAAIDKNIISDEQIVELFWLRNESAIEQTDIKYGKYLYGIAHNILHDKSDCEECKNDTYYSVWNSVPPERPVKFQAYITKIIRNISINRLKEKSRKKRVPSAFTSSIEELADIIQDSSSIEEKYDAAQLGRAISDFLRTLPGKQRNIFICRYCLADTVKDIARMYNVTESSIYKDLSSIRRALAEYLKKEGYTVWTKIY